MRRSSVGAPAADASEREENVMATHPLRSWLLAFSGGSVSGTLAVFFTGKLLFLVGLEREAIISATVGIAMGVVVATVLVVQARVRPR